MLEPKVTTEEGRKLVPVTVSVNVGPPSVVLVGDNDVIVGWEFAGKIVKVAADVVPPLLSPTPTGTVTLMLIVPGFVRSDAKTGTVSWVELTNVAARDTPLKFTKVCPKIKFVPSIVSVPPGELAIMLVGLIEVRAGGGNNTLKNE